MYRVEFFQAKFSIVFLGIIRSLSKIGFIWFFVCYIYYLAGGRFVVCIAALYVNGRREATLIYALFCRQVGLFARIHVQSLTWQGQIADTKIVKIGNRFLCCRWKSC